MYAGHSLAGGCPHRIYMVVVVCSGALVFLLYFLSLFWIVLVCQIALIPLMYLILLLGPPVSLLSWPMLAHHHTLYGHHFCCC